MGRIKTKMIKAKTRDFLERYGDRFGTSFEENKKVLQEVAEVPSKKIRNAIAGYIVRLKKKED